MQIFPTLPKWGSLITTLLAITHFSSALKVIESDSLNSCAANDQENGFTASLFQVAFTPGNNSLSFNIVGFSAIAGNVTVELDVTAYGYSVIKKQLDPCEDQSLRGLCPMVSGQISLPSNIELPSSTVQAVPGIAYTVPDLDGKVQIRIFDKSNGPRNGTELTCVAADLSNGKTVYQKGVGWSTAVIAGIALIVSAVSSGMGHSNTAAHIAANAMSLFTFFQSQAIFGMTAVPLPPIVASWTQNFQWSMGVIKVGFIQDIATWYQKSTGGKPADIFSRLATTSVDVQKRKRSLDEVPQTMSRAARYLNSDLVRKSMGSMNNLVKRQSATGSDTSTGGSAKTITVRGIKRVAFKAGIESTNIFLTGYIFFIIFIGLVVLGLVACKFILDALARAGKIKGDKFQDFRNGWTTVLKGVLFRIVLIGFPQMVILCFWEMTEHDSAGEVALAVITIITMLAMLGWICAKVVLIARRSIALHKNPAYILYSDPVCLHKWGFLYVQFKATAYWFIIPSLAFLLVVGLFIAFAQASGTAQAISLLILNLGYLVALSILRPFMDKKTNAFNISIAAVNFVSSIFMLFFTEIFGLPVSSVA